MSGHNLDKKVLVRKSLGFECLGQNGGGLDGSFFENDNINRFGFWLVDLDFGCGKFLWKTHMWWGFAGGLGCGKVLFNI